MNMIIERLRARVSFKTLMTLFAITAVVAVFWIFRYPTLYYYYLWRLDHTKWVEDLHEDIESIAPRVVPLLVRTYEDVNASRKRRHAAAYGLIKADRKKAEALFVRFLDSEDDEIVRLAIWDLAIAKSDQAFGRILELANHPNKRIQAAVDFYLEQFSDTEAISQLVAAESNQATGKMIEIARHPNARIRLALVDYLGKSNNAAVISILREMEANDPDERVRVFARYQLKRVGKKE